MLAPSQAGAAERTVGSGYFLIKRISTKVETGCRFAADHLPELGISGSKALRKESLTGKRQSRPDTEGFNQTKTGG
ncbi:MAG: hypothetical protein BWY75_03337 [bacterium ADurb.Bin425]|nr:MAG: hypothetical protein BWY75_03337 [bacterium ADurb.Bin425]